MEMSSGEKIVRFVCDRCLLTTVKTDDPVFYETIPWAQPQDTIDRGLASSFFVLSHRPLSNEELLNRYEKEGKENKKKTKGQAIYIHASKPRSCKT